LGDENIPVTSGRSALKQYFYQIHIISALLSNEELSNTILYDNKFISHNLCSTVSTRGTTIEENTKVW